jgi:hypothetical protein
MWSLPSVLRSINASKADQSHTKVTTFVQFFGPSSDLYSKTTLFLLIVCIVRKFYTSVSRKRSLYPRFIDNLYNFFHEFWYTGLMMARKMSRN